MFEVKGRPVSQFTDLFYSFIWLFIFVLRSDEGKNAFWGSQNGLQCLEWPLGWGTISRVVPVPVMKLMVALLQQLSGGSPHVTMDTRKL